MQHEAGKRKEMQPCEHCRQAFVVAGQAAEARGPGETALDDPALTPLGRFVKVMGSHLSSDLFQ